MCPSTGSLFLNGALGKLLRLRGAT
jgi:hypothetical protein